MTLFASLRARILGLAALVGALGLALGVLLFYSSAESRDAFRWVNHSQDVILKLDGLVGDLREAESGLRGYLLTGERPYLDPLERDMDNALRLASELRVLTADNAQQAARAERLQELVVQRVQVMRHALGVATRGSERIVKPQLLARGRDIMASFSEIVSSMRAAERALLVMRSQRVDAKAEQARLILFVGWPVLALLITATVGLILTSISRPLEDLLGAVTRFGAGDRTARAETHGHSIEFQALTRAYNDMADRLVEALERRQSAEGEIARANAELVNRSRALESRSRSTALVSGMSQRLQAVQADHELGEVLGIFLPQVLPDLAGSLYVHNSSRNLLVRAVSWGDPQAAPDTFPPEACWALRRGKEHVVETPGSDLICAHARGTMPVERRCQPVLAGGEVVGLLYMEGRADEEARFRLGPLVENIALALVNDTLRRRLREQSIRDPLTGLFNRRYMEEALSLETARALRGRSPLAVIMADIDHFKRFNDTYGHEAGDVLIRSVAGLIQSNFREGDIVCRYGGEEFIVLAPGATLALACERAETLRRTVREFTVNFREQRLGPVTMSFGIDVWDEGRRGKPEDLVGRADAALYRAKRLGRDRIELGALELQEAAE